MNFDMTCFIVTMDDLIARTLRLLGLIGDSFERKGERFYLQASVLLYFENLFRMFITVIQQKPDLP